jgi:hypothetical protein
LRVYAAAGGRGHCDEVREAVRAEKASGLTGMEGLGRFASRVRGHRERLVGLLEDLAARERTVAGYGAPAKGNTLLNYCGVNRRLLSFTVDKNPLKVGLFTPGTHVPVLPVTALLDCQPDFVLILPWNLSDEIRRQQAEYQRRGGAFILPIPDPRVV